MKKESSLCGRAVVVILACLIAMWTGGCRKSDRASAATRGQDGAHLRLAVVTHGQASDPFWSVVKNGIDQAARDMGATVTYQAPQVFDMVAMSRLIDAEVARKPDGLIVSVPDKAALSRSIRAAVDAGIPVITINAGGEASRELGALLHVGQNEYDAGRAGGERMVAAGVRHAICVNHEVGNVSEDERCRGFIDALEKASGSGRVLAVTASNPTDVRQKVAAALTPEIDGVFALGPPGANPALAALQGTDEKVKLATFDLSPEVLAAITSGKILFAIDQQQYLQGYLPVVLLSQYARHGLMPPIVALPTGPSFVTRENAAAVIDGTKKGIR